MKFQRLFILCECLKNQVLEFPWSCLKFPNFIFQSLILKETRKADRIWEGYDVWFNKISTDFSFAWEQFLNLWLNFPYANCSQVLLLVVEGKIIWRKLIRWEFGRTFTLDLKFVNFLLKFLRYSLIFLIFIFESLNLKEIRKAARISRGYIDWFDEISANFEFVREME
jgi:hypothetical protein